VSEKPTWAEAETAAELRHTMREENAALRTRLEAAQRERDACNDGWRLEIQMRDANNASVAQTVGGEVEGKPTHMSNYLPRLRELVAAARELAASRDVVAAARWVDREEYDTTEEANTSAYQSLHEALAALDAARAEREGDAPAGSRP